MSAFTVLESKLNWMALMGEMVGMPSALHSVDPGLKLEGE